MNANPHSPAAGKAYLDALNQYQLTPMGISVIKAEAEEAEKAGDKRKAENLRQHANAQMRQRGELIAASRERESRKFIQPHLEHALATYGPEHTTRAWENLYRESEGLPAPTRDTVEQWANETGHQAPPKNVSLNGDDFYALARLRDRAAYYKLLASTPDLSVPAPPGSQAKNYPRLPNGRIAELYYTSYGSNMLEERFSAYIDGGTYNGTWHPGSHDPTPPQDATSILLDHPTYYAWYSSRWNGGISFLDYNTPGASIGRSYLISSGQFDDVVAQESGSLLTQAPPQVNLDKTIKRTVKEDDNRLYGTLVHVGDHNNRPIFTFTTNSNIPENLAEEHWSAGMEPPSPEYLRVIGRGLEENHGYDIEKQTTYFRGTPGSDLLHPEYIRAALRGDI